MVAVKKMRCGLVDEEGFQAFSREVIMLSSLDHLNIVTFLGYSLRPVLIIVMEFVMGGTLSDWIDSHEDEHAPEIQTKLKILAGSAKGIEYLHHEANDEGVPILHRDIK